MPNIVIFIGPSLPHECVKSILPTAKILPPAKRGDFTTVVATEPDLKVIVLIDGVFFQDRAVGHREILSAINKGILVYGASSLGALRASEMDCLGMIGIGEIYKWYHDKYINADDEVCLIYDPITYKSISEPMVNIRATLIAAKLNGIINQKTESELISICKNLYYPDRTYRRIIRDSNIPPETKTALSDWIKTHSIDQKRIDAMNCLKSVKDLKL